jgi:AGZA family xanthine/uracil permease-like MFS transporter
MFERVFRLREFGTDVRTEIVAGTTTFLTMSYIIVVNPGILEAAGIPVGPSMVATIIASAVGCILMAFYANRPIAIAPYMGENAFIAFTVVLSLGYSWQAGITAVFIGGILFVVVTAVRLRSWLAASIPTNLKYAFAVAIGLFLTFIGLMTTGIVENSAQGVPTKVGQLTSPQVLLALFAFFFIVALMIRKVRGAIIVGIIVTSALAYLGKGLGWYLPDVTIPGSIVSAPPSLAPIA